MATADHLPFLSPAEYLEIERAAAEKSEYYDWRMYAIAGGTANHSLLGQSAGSEIRFALRGKGRRTFNSYMRIHIPGYGSVHLRRCGCGLRKAPSISTRRTRRS